MVVDVFENLSARAELRAALEDRAAQFGEAVGRDFDAAVEEAFAGHLAEGGGGDEVEEDEGADVVEGDAHFGEEGTGAFHVDFVGFVFRVVTELVEGFGHRLADGARAVGRVLEEAGVC